MPLPITSDGKQCGSSGSAYIECTKVDGKQFYNITSSPKIQQTKIAVTKI